MNARRLANPAQSLLTLIEQRFGLRMPTQSAEHLARVREHYLARRKFLLWQHGEAGALARPEYAKAVMISEAARLLLREFEPSPRRKHAKRGTPQ